MERMNIMNIMTQPLKVMLLALLGTIIAVPAWAVTDRQVREAVEDELGEILPEDNNPGGAAVVVRIDGRTLFFNFGTATRGKPITSDTLFNLASLGKTFDTTLLSMAAIKGELSLDDPVTRSISELRSGGAINNIRLDQLLS